MPRNKKSVVAILFLLVIVVVFWYASLLFTGKENIELPQECVSQRDGYKKWFCFTPYFEAITQRVSTGAARAEAQRLKNQGIVSDCHLFAHVIGETSLEKHNFDMGQALSLCGAGACRDGCFHGVMERYVRYATDPSDVVSKLQNTCDSVIDGLLKSRCVHGIGHGLIAHNFLPIQDALMVCESLGSDWEAHCVSGLMTEHLNRYLNYHLPESDLKKALPNICAPFDGATPSFKMNTCLSQVSFGLMYYTGHDVERSRTLCEALPRQEYIDACKNYIPVHIKDKKPSTIDIKEFLERYKDIEPFQW